MPIACHPSRWLNWYMPEDEKKDVEKQGLGEGISYFSNLICLNKKNDMMGLKMYNEKVFYIWSDRGCI